LLGDPSVNPLVIERPDEIAQDVGQITEKFPISKLVVASLK
jgi:hypothetical protein